MNRRDWLAAGFRLLGATLIAFGAWNLPTGNFAMVLLGALLFTARPAQQ